MFHTKILVACTGTLHDSTLHVALTIAATLRHGHTHHTVTYVSAVCKVLLWQRCHRSREKSLQAFPPIFLQSSETKSRTESLGSRLLKSWESDCVFFFETVTGKRLMGSDAVERFECFPDSGLSSLIESYYVVIFISSPTLFPIRATTFTDDTFGPREPMVPLRSWFRCSMYKSHGMFFPRRPCTFTVRSQTNCCFILGVKMKSCWASGMKASLK